MRVAMHGTLLAALWSWFTAPALPALAYCGAALAQVASQYNADVWGRAMAGDLKGPCINQSTFAVCTDVNIQLAGQNARF